MKEIRLCDSGKLEEVADICARYSLGIEVQSFYDIPKLNPQVPAMVQKHKEILANINGGKSLHGPFKSYEMGHDDPEIVAIIKKRYQAGYDIARELGCTGIVFHDNYRPESYGEEGYARRSIEFLKNFLIGKDNSIMIYIENQFELTPRILKKIIDGVNDPRVKACLDIGHVHANADIPVEEWITELEDRIGYIHLHNNHGRTIDQDHHDDEHLGITDGTINIDNVLQLLEENCPDAIWNLECGCQYLIESLEYLKSKGYINSSKIL